MTLNGFEVTNQGSSGTPDAPRAFTPRQANAALPLVQRIVSDIVEAYREAHDLHRRLHTLPETATSQEATELMQARDVAVGNLEGFREELGRVGCELKDPECGLIDFPGRRNGQPVCLCWKLGEPSVAYWHDLDAGFVGRRPISNASA